MNPKLKLEQSYLSLPDTFYERLEPKPVLNPDLVYFNVELADTLGLSFELDAECTSYFAGNRVEYYPMSIAQAYAGHQYGHFTMLGDGRALLLGETHDLDNVSYDIQLKGSGRTRYSRGGDGKATLGAMVRECIVSEAMYGLHIPTTRSLALITTNEPVYREYAQMGAILTRVAASHIRCGTFEYAYRFGSGKDVEKLAEYVRLRHFPSSKDYQDMYHQIVERQANLIAKWQLCGFVHGVMNTDNMSICGETIDYGPCAFLDTYNPFKSFSSIDYYGRYAFNQQPEITKWNLTRLGETLLPLMSTNPLDSKNIINTALNLFTETYQVKWLNGMYAKLGFLTHSEDDEILVVELLRIMEQEQLDYTNTFVYLSYRVELMNQPWSLKWETSELFMEWYQRWSDRISCYQVTDLDRQLKSTNPRFIARNHLVEHVIALMECGDDELFNEFLCALKDPFNYDNPDYLSFFQANPPIEQEDYLTYCGT